MKRGERSSSKSRCEKGMYIERSGEFENQLHAKRTLQVVFPMVLVLILVILYLTCNDFMDAVLTGGLLVSDEVWRSMKVIAFIEPPQSDVIENILRHCGCGSPQRRVRRPTTVGSMTRITIRTSPRFPTSPGNSRL